MPSLTGSTDGLEEAFAEHLGPGYSPVPVSTCLSESPDGRRVVELRFRRLAGSGQDARLIAKRFPGAAGEATFLAMKTLEARPPAPPLCVPRAFFFLPGTRTLGLERAPGRSYRELASQADFPEHLRLAGAALASLHSLGLPDLPAKWVDDHLGELMRPSTHALASALPEHGPLIGEIIGALREGERLVRDAVAAAPVHRDFHLGQLLRAGRRVWLIDWDHLARGDPALDLGNFSVYLRTRVPDVAERGWEAFLGGYVARCGAGAVARVPLYEALTYLRLACKRFRLKQDGWPDETANMLRLAGERLG